MKKIFLFILILFAVFFANAQNCFWAKGAGGGSNENGQNIATDLNGNVYVIGDFEGSSITFGSTTLNNSNVGTGAYFIAKYSPSGTVLWAKGANGIAAGFGITTDNSGNVYVAGEGNNEFMTVKYSQPTGINPISSDIPKSYSLSQNYPNPFNPSTKIKFGVPKNGVVHLVIYDAIGREVSTLVNEQLNAGTYEAEWNALNFPSGVYFSKLVSGDYSETKKLVLVK